MTSLQLDGEENRRSFFQGCVERMLLYWRDHQALASIDIAVLDRERPRILKNIALGLELQGLWPLVKPLVIAFAPYMERRGHWDAWHSVLEQAIRMAQRAGDIESETTLTAFLARVCQRMSRYDEVVRYYRRVIRLAKVIGNRFEEARACSNLGYYFIDGGRWWRSEVLSCHALAIFEELESDHGRAHTHNHLGLLYTRERRWGEATIQLERACQLWEKSEDMHSLIHGYGNLGILYHESSLFLQSLDVLQKAIALAVRTGETSLMGSYWLNMGINYILINDLDNAQIYMLKAETSFRTHSNSLGLAQSWHNLALILIAQENFSVAEQYLEDAKLIFMKLDNIEGTLKVVCSLIDYHLLRVNTQTTKKYLDELRKLANFKVPQTQRDYYEYEIAKYEQRLAKG